MASFVLDASAVLAVLLRERGFEAVANALNDAIMLSVNYAEVIGKLVERGMSLAESLAMLRSIDLVVVDFNFELAQRTGELRAETRRQGLSLADRACLALAEREQTPALTGDKKWLGAASGIEVVLFR